ncbi:MAG: tRNA lysidine(34) synthetase TilS [Eubacteriales bacterium]|nr:tRNA lysidine(34) synthetase TilS [Eubacteriales bacterium]
MKKGIEMIRQYRMIEEGDHVIAGVSGGPDSVYLLFLLTQYQKSVPFSISVVHVEHGIRGQESREDAQFVQRLCKKMELPFFLFEVDAQKEARTKKISTEEAGRILRYHAFEEVCRRSGANKIAIAHNEDDQAETILWNLARGSGLAGLCGMQPVRGKLIRPMLTTSRTEIEQWLEENEIETRQDKTNLEEIYTRNKIRHQIIPRLKEGINAQAVRHIAEAGQKIQKAEAFLQKMTDQAQEVCLERSENSARIQIEPFLNQEAIIQEYLIRRAVSEVSDGLKDFTNRHMEALLKIARGAEQAQTNLPGGVIGRKEKGLLILSQAETDCREKKNIFIEVPVPGIVQLENGMAEFTLEETKCQRIPEKSYTKWIDYDTIKSRLILRSRLPGDYLIINKEGGKKKLKDYLIDRKVPREERDSILLLADGSHILWVVGFRISEACKVKESTKHILKIQITKENKDGTQD